MSIEAVLEDKKPLCTAEAPQTPYANHHIPAFLALSKANDAQHCNNKIQVISDGRQLTTCSFLSGKLSLQKPLVVTDSPRSIGMKLPAKPLTLRGIADIIGPDFPVSVIDVQHQEELHGWTLADLVEYFEDERRLMSQSQQTASSSSRSRRRVAQKPQSSDEFERPRVLNQISLEFSATKLAPHVQSPAVARDLDWVTQAWPSHWKQEAQVYPAVQYYCLTSAAGCYTDFHVDFGGSSVWYHVLSGQKQFCLIEPSEANLKVYETWLCSKQQAFSFLPESIVDKTSIVTIALEPHQTLLIPSAWIHAVYTPVDSLVLGGNFLHGLDMERQIQINSLEVRSHVPERFRFPFFKVVQFYAGRWYFRKLRAGDVCQREVDGLPALIHALEGWWNVHQNDAPSSVLEPTVVSAAQDVARDHHCESFEEFLTSLKAELERVVQEGVRPNQQQPQELSSSPVVKFPMTQDAAKGRACLDNADTDTPKSPSGAHRVRLKLSTTKKEANVSPFHITLSQQPSPILVRSPPRPKDTFEPVASDRPDLADDEWIPARQPKRAKIGKRQASSRPVPKKAKTTTSRQRLSKLFGR